MFYWDVPLDHPAFSAIQWLSVRKGIQGFLTGCSGHETPLTPRELAVLAVKTLELCPV